MPELLGYGEDALTYWALTHQFQNILKQLQDESTPAECLVFYRPSFGRAGKTKGKNESLPRGPQFGEFDAIIATPKAIYLVESKWNKSSKKRNEPFRVEKRQRWRHRVMREYITRWRGSPTRFESWGHFLNTCENKSFDINERKYILCGKKTRLSKNLEYVLNRLSSFGEKVQNVLLYLKRTGDPDLHIDNKDEKTNDHFCVVNIDYPPTGRFISFAYDK